MNTIPRRWRASALLGLALLGLVLPAQRGAAIVNGLPVSPERFAAETPWAVLVSDSGEPSGCTGTLIAPRWVLTAGHCADDGVVVYFGSPDRSGTRRVAVREVIRHPLYQSGPMRYDLGLLRLVRPLRIPPLPIAGKAEAWSLLTDGRKATILGWGRITPDGQWPERLRWRELELRDVALVGTTVAYTSDVAGPCGGDSGGPLVVRGGDGQPLLLGVASMTDGNLCEQGGGAAAYTHVAGLLDFIRAHVPELPDRPPPLEFAPAVAGLTRRDADGR